MNFSLLKVNHFALQVGYHIHDLLPYIKGMIAVWMAERIQETKAKIPTEKLLVL